MLKEYEKKFVNDDFLLNNTSIWKEKKNRGSPPLYTFKDLSFSYVNLDWAASQTVVTQGNFPHTPPPRSVHSSSVLFPFKLLLVSLPTLPPTKQQINIAWPMMWSTLHVSLYCKALCITTTGDWKRGKEKRGIYKCSVVSNASYKKKKPSRSFCSTQ